jgi:Ca-activated chloride channel family protein
VLATAGLAAGFVALARPFALVPVPEERKGIDILLCVDTSSSMASTDLDPERTRLDVAKAAAAKFIAARPDDRIGLVTFARYPDLRCPLTSDHVALREIVAAVPLVTNEGPEDATGIGTATARAAQVLAAGESGSRVVILLTDGEENVAVGGEPGEIAPLHAGQLAERLGLRVYVIAAGTGTKQLGGRVVPIDTTAVEDLARRTGGRFYRAKNADAVTGVYEEIDALEKARFAEPRFEVEDRYLPFLVGALLLLGLSRLFAYGPGGVLP